MNETLGKVLVAAVSTAAGKAITIILTTILKK